MPFDTGKHDLDSLSNELLRRLVEVQRDDAADKGDLRPIREAAFHDFAAYRLLLKPKHVTFTGEEDDDSPADLDVWKDWDWFLEDFPDTFLVAFETVIIEEQVTLVDEGRGSAIIEAETVDFHQVVETDLRPMVLDLTSLFKKTMGLVLFDMWQDAVDKTDFTYRAREAVQRWLTLELKAMTGADNRIREEDFDRLRSVDFWLAGVTKVKQFIGTYAKVPPPSKADEPPFGAILPANYSFTPFEPDSVNLGFRVLYRQTWTPIGTQRGEVVRTLPLGPRQSEKIGIKVVNTARSNRTSESARSVETSTEASATSKDSHEIVAEASGKFHWDINADVSVPIDVAQVGVGGGMGGEAANSSRDTKSQLNETMKKTASKLRSDTKLVVTLERERTDERSHFSEIVNPNDEIAVTYVYSRLQRRYEIQASMTAVDAVIYVAERVPAPKEMTGAWIRRYDWVISRALLDDSFQADLDIVRNHEYSQTEVEAVDDNIRRLMQTLSGTSDGAAGIPDYSGVDGRIPDLYANQQQAYEREVERRRARQAEHEAYQRSVRRLRAHLYDNVLHYCRAIWSSEDPNARYLRYRAIRVPVRWEFVGSGVPSGHLVEGDFTPAITDVQSDTAMLVDLVDLSGPIGYCGNYAVYRMRASDNWPSLTGMLDLARLPYMRIAVGVAAEDPKRRPEFECFGAASTTRVDERRYQLEYKDDDTPFFLLLGESAPSVYTELDKLPYTPGRPLQFEALRVWISPRAGSSAPLKAGDTFLVDVRLLPVLEDPERRSLQWSAGHLRSNDEGAFFTPETIEKFGEFFADCAEVLAKVAKAQAAWTDLNAAAQGIFLGRYFDYLLKIRHTQHILVDSNDVILTREVDTASSIEPFKSLHRYIDALNAFEDMTGKRLENRRIAARLDANLLGDPDVDRVTVVASDGSTPFVAAIDAGGASVVEDDD